MSESAEDQCIIEFGNYWDNAPLEAIWDEFDRCQREALLSQRP